VASVDPAPAKPLVLTSPPADWEEPRAASAGASLAAERDELETPLFDDGWDGAGALSGRIVHHEASAEHDARATRFGLTGPYVLLGFIGFVAFGGALFAFSRGRTPAEGVGNPVVLAWILALIGAACVGVSGYFLFRRLGGQED
jgi:lysozyme